MLIWTLIVPVCILPVFLNSCTRMLQSAYKEFADMDETVRNFSIGIYKRGFASFGVDGFGSILRADSYVLMLLLWIMKQGDVVFSILLIAYFTYTYRKAAKFEKNMAPASQSSRFFSEKLNEIEESLQVIQARHNLMD